MTSSNKITSVESSFERLMRRPQLLRENGRWIGLICRKWDYGWWLSPLRQYRLSDCIIGTCLHHVNIAAKNSTYHPYASFMFVSLTNGESCRCLGDSLISIFWITDIYIFHVYPTSPHTHYEDVNHTPHHNSNCVQQRFRNYINIWGFPTNPAGPHLGGGHLLQERPFRFRTSAPVINKNGDCGQQKDLFPQGHTRKTRTTCKGNV